MKIGDQVIYRGYNGSRLDATVSYVYEGECAGELAIIVNTDEGTKTIDRVPQWDGRPEHLLCWEPKGGDHG